MARQYDLSYKPGEDALQYYKRLAKVADQRLVRLEKLEETPNFESVTAYAYARAQRDISRYTEGGHLFNTKLPLNADGTVNTRLLNEKIADIKTFISSVSSTKSGIVSTYEKRAKTLNDKYGTAYTWEDLADYFQSGDFEKHKKDYGSETIFKALGKIKRAENKVLKDIDGNNKRQIKDQVALDVAVNMLKNKNTHTFKMYTSEERQLLISELERQKR